MGYQEGRIVEDAINRLIRAGRAGKVKYQPFPQNLENLCATVERLARKDLGSALPYLPQDKADWAIEEVWDTVLHTDLTVNRAGWVVAVDWTLRSDEVDFKMFKMDRVMPALSRLGVDRAVVVLIHQCEDGVGQAWVPELDDIIRKATQGDDFVSTGQILF